MALLLVVAAASGILLHHPGWLGPVASPPLCLVVDPHQPGRLLRGTHWGVEASHDSGITWREVPMLVPPTDVARILFASGPGESALVYAMGARSVVVSDDGGRVWRELTLPQDEPFRAARLLDLAQAGTGQLNLLTTVGQFQRVPDGTWRAVGEPVRRGSDRRQWVHDLHTGQLFEQTGRRVGEGAGWGLLLLVGTGLVLYGRHSRKRR